MTSQAVLKPLIAALQTRGEMLLLCDEVKSNESRPKMKAPSPLGCCSCLIVEITQCNPALWLFVLKAL